MADTRTADRVRAVVAETMGKPLDQITDDATFETLEADSLDIVETVIAIELEWDGGVVIDEDKFTMASTIGDLIKEVEAAANGQG